MKSTARLRIAGITTLVFLITLVFTTEAYASDEIGTTTDGEASSSTTPTDPGLGSGGAPHPYVPPVWDYWSFTSVGIVVPPCSAQDSRGQGLLGIRYRYRYKSNSITLSEAQGILQHYTPAAQVAAGVEQLSTTCLYPPA